MRMEMQSPIDRHMCNCSFCHRWSLMGVSIAKGPHYFLHIGIAVGLVCGLVVGFVWRSGSL